MDLPELLQWTWKLGSDSHPIFFNLSINQSALALIVSILWTVFDEHKNTTGPYYLFVMLTARSRDTVYLIIVGSQFIGMLLLDLVIPFYPKSLYESPTAPLHFLINFRNFYISTTGDPFFTHDLHESWFEAFLYIEGLVQLPLTAYLTYKFATSAKTNANTEIAGLALGCLTWMGSMVVVFVLSQMDVSMVDSDKKLGLYGQYVPFAVIPFLMALDMRQRLLSRIGSIETKSKSQ